eukprot:s501_g11.t2
MVPHGGWHKCASNVGQVLAERNRVLRLDDDSDEEHSPYAEVDLGDDDWSFAQGTCQLDASKHHRMDINDTPGSIRAASRPALEIWMSWTTGMTMGWGAWKGERCGGGSQMVGPKIQVSQKQFDQSPVKRKVGESTDRAPEVDLGDDDSSFAQGTCELDASKHHRMDINDTPGSIRDLNELDNWYDDGSPVPAPRIRNGSIQCTLDFKRSTSMGSGRGHCESPLTIPTKPADTPKAVEKGPKGKGKAKGPVCPSSPVPASSSDSPMSSVKDGSESPSRTPPPKGKGPSKGPAKGPAKGPGKGTPPAKGPGKGPALPPTKGGPKAKGEGKAKAVPRLQGNAPLGRKIHWGAHYEEPHADSVFSSLNHEILFNPDLLKEMLSAESAPAVTRRKSLAKKPAGITILDGSRAQNLAIVMSKMKVSTEEFCQNLKELNFSEECMSPDDVELLIHVLPTAEENKKLIEYKDRVADLRDVEQNVMPFCVLHKGVVRMKVAKFALSHVMMYQAVNHRCEVLKLASEQVRTSVQFREMLGVVLKVGNFINHGVKEMVEGAIRGISVESLSSLASFKTGAVSTMHFLCLSFMSKDFNFFQDLKESMSHVHEASKEKFVLLKGSIEAFASEVEMAKRQLLMLLDVEDDPELALGEEREAELRQVMGEWVKEKDDLHKAGEEAFKACCESQKYFSISDRAQADPNASEAFFVHIASFLDLFQEAWLEIKRNPRKWDDFAEKAGLQLQREKRRSLPAMTQVSSDGRSTESATGSTTVARRSLRRGDSAMQARPSQRRLSTRDSVSRRPVAFVASLSGCDLRTPEVEPSSKQIARSLLNTLYSAVAHKRSQGPSRGLDMNGSCPLNFALQSESNGRGDRCVGPNYAWTCPKGCVSTGDPTLDCRHIDPGTHRCAGACDAANVPGETGEVTQDPSAAALVPLSDLPLVVKGSRLVGRSETTYQLACVNWYGAHMEMLVNNGLNVKGLEEIASFIVQLKAFNCVRLPYSVDSLNMSNEEIPGRFSALCHNPELQAATPLQIFDATVKALTDAGLLVVLNNHVFRRGWCCSFDDGEGLWYNEDFEESVWLHHLGFMSSRYKDNPRVVGFDIRNEIRSTAHAVPSWGTGRVESDWALAAAKGSRRVLQEDPDMLVFVSGLEYSMYLCRVPAYPLHLQPEFQSHIIYTSHEYDWYLSPPQFLQTRAVNASMFFLLCFFATSAALLLLVPLALMVCKQQAIQGSRVGCCRGRVRRCMRCSVMLQALAAVVWVALFHALLFLLGRALADPCGKTDFTASIIFGLLWLPGFCLSLRLPWLLLSQLLPLAVAAAPSIAAAAPPTPSTAADSTAAEGQHAVTWAQIHPECTEKI